MRLTLHTNDERITFTSDAIGTREMVDICGRLLLAAGHAPVNVAGAMVEVGTEWSDAWDEKSVDTPQALT